MLSLDQFGVREAAILEMEELMPRFEREDTQPHAFIVSFLLLNAIRAKKSKYLALQSDCTIEK